MKYKAVVFDFDGLMFETEKVWKEFTEKGNSLFNINITEEKRLTYVGMNEKEIRCRLIQDFPNINVDEYRNWLKCSVYNHIDSVGAEEKKGLKNLIKHCKTNNIQMAIASGSEKKRIVSCLQKAKISSKNFSVFATGEKKIKPKPNPDIFLYVCKKLKVAPTEVIVLEDSYNGVRAGSSAGCFTIMIPDLMPVTPQMKQTASLILNDLDEVINFLRDKV